MQTVNVATITATEKSCVEQLAKFFPGMRAFQLSVQVTALRPGNSALREAATVEYSTPQHAIFLSSLPLEFDDRVRLQGEQPGCTAEAAVVAVQYHEGRKAVAVQFLQGPCAWVTQQ